MKKNKVAVDNSRSRCFNVVFYGTEQELTKIILHNLERISHYVYILHNKDVYEEDKLDDNNEFIHRAGELKKEHYHILLDYYNGHSFNAVKKMFTTDNDNPRVEKVTDRRAFFRYLTHKDEKNAYHYQDSELVSDDLEFYRKLEKVGDSTHADVIARQIVEDLIAKVPLRVMLQRYGRDFIIHYNQYKDMAFFITEEERLAGYKEKEDLPF